MYNEKLMQIFAKPKNVGIIKCADGVGEAKNEYGEIAKIFISVQDNIVVDAKFKAYGSTVIIASGSVLTTIIKGKTIDEAINISTADIIAELGNEIEEESMPSVICIKDAMLLAIKDYKDKQ